MDRSLASVALALAASLGAAAPARAQAEPAWLRSRLAERYEAEVVGWRRSGGWERGLIAVALDEARPHEARERALALLGATGDDPIVQQALAELQLQLSADPHLVPHVRRALDRSWARRRAFDAIQQVPLGGDARALAAGLDGEALFEAYALARDPLSAVAPAAARLIGAALPEDPSIDEQLVDVARAGRPDAREAALTALLARGRAQAIAAGVAGALRAAADEPDEGGRAAVVAAVAGVVARRGDEALEAFCRRALAQDVPEPARVLAARGLGRAGATGAVGWLRAQLRGGGPELVAAAAAALVRLGVAEPELLRALVEAVLSGGAGARDAAEGLLSLGADRLEPLVRAGLADPEPERRQRALELAYAAAPRSLSPVLAELVRSADAPWSARHLAIMTLGRVGGPQALGALSWTVALREGGSEAGLLRRAAVEALGACAPGPGLREDPAARAAREVLEAALDDPDVALRCAVLDALAAWGDPAARPALTARLSTPARSTAERLARARTCERLGLTDPTSAARVLGLLSEDADSDLALGILSYARALDEPLAVPAALGLLSHRSASVRRAAGAELRRRRASGGGPEVDEGAPLFSPDHKRAVQAWREWWERRRPR